MMNPSNDFVEVFVFTSTGDIGGAKVTLIKKLWLLSFLSGTFLAARCSTVERKEIPRLGEKQGSMPSRVFNFNEHCCTYDKAGLADVPLLSVTLSELLFCGLRSLTKRRSGQSHHII